jgi:site-specific DNA-cytosine methylase
MFAIIPETFSVEEFEGLNANVLMMSPPCQPFTRNGKKMDASDPRTKSFLHVMHVLKEMKVSMCLVFRREENPVFFFQ